MGVKYVKDFSFPSSGGFHGDVQRYAKGGHVTKLPAKAKASAKGMPARAKPNAPARGAPKMESKPKMGKGQGYEKGGYVPGKEKDVLPTKSPPGMGKDLAPARRFKGKYEGYAEGGEVFAFPRPDSGIVVETLMPPDFDPSDYEDRGEDRGGRGEVISPSPLAQMARRRAMMAREDMAMRPGMRVPMYAKGGEVKGKSKIAKVMGEYKRGELHSGSKKGPKVKSREQAVAIALSEARKAGAKIPKKAEGGKIYSTEYLAYGDKKVPYRGSPEKAKMLGRRDRRAREAMERAEKYAPGMSLDMQDRDAVRQGKMARYAKGGGFPDLTGDGKVTRADVLKGRGVFKKGGMAKHKDVKMDKAMMRKAVHKHEKAMHPGKKLTKLSNGGVPSYGRKPMYGGGKC